MCAKRSWGCARRIVLTTVVLSLLATGCVHAPAHHSLQGAGLRRYLIAVDSAVGVSDEPKKMFGSIALHDAEILSALRTIHRLEKDANVLRWHLSNRAREAEYLGDDDRMITNVFSVVDYCKEREEFLIDLMHRVDQLEDSNLRMRRVLGVLE